MSMSNSESPSLSEGENIVELVVETGDVAAEVYVINANLHLVGRKYGESVLFLISPGTYKIKVRTGQVTQERLVELNTRGDLPHKEFFELQAFASPIPLQNTLTTNESQSRAAHNHSLQYSEQLGTGSSLLFFLRCPTYIRLEESHQVLFPTEHYATQLVRGLTLHDFSGKLLVDFEEKATFSPKSELPWAVYSAQVVPGYYRLRLNTEDTSFEQIIVACAGWQCQWFALPGDYTDHDSSTPSEESVISQANLSSASLCYAPENLAFDPSSNAIRLIDITRMALLRNRLALSDDLLNEILHGKLENPMLGIFGAHLLLSGKLDGTRYADSSLDERFVLIRTVVENLRSLLGNTHPDVEALALGVGLSTSDTTFNCPPMLLRSWLLIMEMSASRPNLVPIESLAGRTATRLWAVEPWMVWSSPEPDDVGSLVSDFILSLTGSIPQAVAASALSPVVDELDDEIWSRLLWSVVQSTSESSSDFKRFSSTEFAHTILPSLSLDQYTQLVRLAGVPRSIVDDRLGLVERTPRDEQGNAL